MAKHMPRTRLAEIAVAQPETPLVTAEVDRTFGLPPVLHALSVGSFMAFLGVMALGFGNAELALPLVICAIIVGAMFYVPMKWAQMDPPSRSRALGWSRFTQGGVQTLTGRITAKDAAVQVLVLPFFILAWGIATVVIARLVS